MNLSLHRDDEKRISAAWALVAYTLVAVAAGVVMAVAAR